ncbi:hypothetical protein [Sphingopyxis sp. MWB1]|uniref:hypothetical protein n=1 Tax=Sphingopyxis sp. MWB1 TaxID=1537715 RepID=UPI00051A604E|nr:hypothetical protein [Sphingopyxis sp. MWB1]
MRQSLHYAAATAAIAAMLATVPVFAQRTSGPKQRYEMDVATMSGMGAPGSGGAAMGSMVGMMLGGRENPVTHMMQLRLGSGQTPATPPVKADHFFEPQAKLGASLPLWSPERSQPGTSDMPFDPPKGRLLLYWGCGAKAGPGQPVVIDFSKLAAGQTPPNLFSTAAPLIRTVSEANSAAYADWPNRKSGKAIPRGSSLLGTHRIASNVGTDIRFTLDQDYMPGLRVSTQEQGDGSVLLRWDPVAAATGYVAWTFGSTDRGQGDMIWWTSSNSREFGGGLWDWLPPATVAKLVAQKIVMPPAQTSCQIPAEVKKASGEMMFGNLNAFGPEAQFSYPPKPAGNAPWIIDWTAKVRFRSAATLMIGADFGGLSGGGDTGGSDNADREDENSAPRKKKKKCKGPLGIPLPDAAC